MDTTKTISWAAAWHHCAGTSSYWLWIIGIAIGWVLAILAINAMANKMNKDLDKVKLWTSVVFFMALAFSILASPSSIAANTSEAMAAKGHFIY